MTKRMSQGGAFLFASALLVPAPRAVACDPPALFDYVHAFAGEAAWEGAADTPCSLRTTLASGGYVPWASGFANMRLPASEAHLRLHFHLDLTDLAPPVIDPAQTVTFAKMVATSATTVNPAMRKTASIASILLWQTDSDGVVSRTFLLAAVDAMSPVGWTGIEVPLPASNAFDVDFDVLVGPAGSVKLWIDGDPEASPPTVQLNVVNSAWSGIAGAAIGQFDATANYLAAQSGRNVVLSDIRVPRPDFIFHDRFE